MEYAVNEQKRHLRGESTADVRAEASSTGLRKHECNINVATSRNTQMCTHTHAHTDFKQRLVRRFKISLLNVWKDSGEEKTENR